jgi:CRISPR-associated protein Cmr1
MTEPHHILTAKYRVVTPMFLSGADPNYAELRLPSFKGALRFWWRALAAEHFGKDLQKLRDAEDTLFGSTRTGASRVRMRLISCGHTKVLKQGVVLCDGGTAGRVRVVGEGARYLGYGAMEAFKSSKKGTEAGQLLRACLQSPFSFEVELIYRGLKETQSGPLLNAAKALGLMGGLGTRTRKGYGSIVLEELSLDGEAKWNRPQTMEELCGAIKALYNAQVSCRLPEYTALSSLSRHVILKAKESATPLKLLDMIGQEMMCYRSWGHRGKVLGQDSERNFKDDHDLMKLEPARRKTHPRRIVFGLPHNYGKAQSDQIPPKTDRDLHRRASPLLLHIHECGNQPVAVLSFFPATFLPEGDQAQINVGGKKVRVTPNPAIWKPVEELLDRFATDRNRKEPFDKVLEVRP